MCSVQCKIGISFDRIILFFLRVSLLHLAVPRDCRSIRVTRSLTLGSLRHERAERP